MVLSLEPTKSRRIEKKRLSIFVIVARSHLAATTGRRFLLGSVANRAVFHADRSVLGRANANRPFHRVSERRPPADALFGVALAPNRRQVVIVKAGAAADLLPLYPQPLYFTN